MEKAKKLLKEINDSGFYVINGRSYEIMTFTHGKRVKIWAYFTSVTVLVEAGNYSFMDSDKFKEIEFILFENIVFEKNKLSAAHFEKYPMDYINFITTMLGVISYPFFSESLIG